MSSKTTALVDRLTLLVATGFGISLISPFAPGTFGSIPGLALAIALSLLALPWQIAAALILVLAAVPVCSRAETLLGLRDDGRISADEWMLFPLATLGIPLASLPWQAILVFFAVVRIIDVIKPPPAYALQRLPRGWGVVSDDAMANLYALVINWSAYLLFFK